MQIRQVVNSVFMSCSYVLTQGGDTWLVDCGDIDRILPVVDGNVHGILLTHSHFDHIYGLNHLLARFPGLPIFTNQAGREGLLSDKMNFSRYHQDSFILDRPENIIIVKDGDRIPLFEGVEAIAVETPGHSPCCIAWMVGDAVFTGDSYIPGVKTVTNFPQSDKELAALSEGRIMRLSQQHQVYPGHASQFEK